MSKHMFSPTVQNEVTRHKLS